MVKSSDSKVDESILLSDGCDLYLQLTGASKGTTFVETANRNNGHVTKMLVDRSSSPHSSNDAEKKCINFGRCAKIFGPKYEGKRVINLS